MPDLPDLQLLIYANTDLANAAPSMQEKAKGFGLEAGVLVAPEDVDVVIADGSTEVT